MVAALEEQQAGTNPEALLFPSQKGGMLWYSAFNRSCCPPWRPPAGRSNGVDTRDEWDASAQKYTRVIVERRKAGLPWHSLRHRFARIAVDIKKMERGLGYFD